MWVVIWMSLTVFFRVWCRSMECGRKDVTTVLCGGIIMCVNCVVSVQRNVGR